MSKNLYNLDIHSSAALQKLTDFAKNASQDLLSFSNGRMGCKVVSSSLSSINGIPYLRIRLAIIWFIE